MRRLRPARILAPLALLVALAAVYIVVNNANVGSSSDTSTPSSRPATAAKGASKATKAADRKAAKGAKTYVVKPGDTLTSIAESTKVGADQISELNPNLDPQGLQPGQKIKIRP